MSRKVEQILQCMALQARAGNEKRAAEYLQIAENLMAKEKARKAKRRARRKASRVLVASVLEEICYARKPVVSWPAGQEFVEWAREWMERRDAHRSALAC